MASGAARSLLSGAARYFDSLLVGVVLAPVLPDVAVDLFGVTDAGLRNAALRVVSLLVVVGVCILVYRLQLGLAARRARRAGYRLAGIGQREVLVLPIGFNSAYRPVARRTGGRSVTEWLIDSVQPRLVVAVGTPEVAAIVHRLAEALREEGVAVETVEISDASDPDIAVAEAQRRVIDAVDGRGLLGASTYVDTTGGTVAMSLAMLRVGALLAAECTYVASRFANKQPVPGSQQGRAFDPVAMFATPP